MPREIFLNQKGNELMFGGKSEGEEVVRGKHSHVQQAGGQKTHGSTAFSLDFTLWLMQLPPKLR